MKIDNVEFNSQSEYMAGLRDKNRIESIKSRVDLNNPQAAGELYKRLKSQPSFFETELGRQFVRSLSRSASLRAAGIGNGVTHTDHSEEIESSERESRQKASSERTSAPNHKTLSNRQAVAGKSAVSGYKSSLDQTSAPKKSLISIVDGPESLKKAYNNTANDEADETEKRAAARSKALNELISEDRDLNEFWEDDEGKKPDPEKKKKIRKFLFAGLALVAAVVLVIVLSNEISYRISDYRSNKKMQELQNTVLQYTEASNRRVYDASGNVITANAAENTPTASASASAGTEPAVTETPEITSEPSVLPEYSSLYKRNNDMVGWIQIPGTVINYPVMQTKSDMEYYLSKDFDRSDDRNGLPFVDSRCDVFTPTTNVIIYGHCMNSGAMFATLLKYKDESFYEEHPVIYFDTIYERAEYQIVAAFQSRVLYTDETAFRYYSFVNASTEEEFNEFIANIKLMCTYDTGVTATFGDSLITLSTCDSEIKNGRMVIVAKRINN